MIICIAGVGLWLIPKFFLERVDPGDVGVRQSAVSGVYEEDLDPGWHWRIPGVHKLIHLPKTYKFLEYTDEAGSRLQIRTKDNNIVFVDVSVPIRIVPGKANELVSAGNHVRDSDGSYRFERLARETTVSVLREDLANLDSKSFLSTKTRLEVAGETLKVLNESLAEHFVEAESILIRAVAFRPEYENQLQRVQLNEQEKLLDNAKKNVANEQQKLDAYQQGTEALAAAREQDWVKRRADLERAYEVGFIDTQGDDSPGAARTVMDGFGDDKTAELLGQAAEVFSRPAEELNQSYLLGIKNIEAETLEYRRRVGAEADGIAARLAAEGEAKVAQVQGNFESKVNALLNSPAGRAYVAWKTAAHVKFAETLVFQSRDGIPSVLRLRDFALKFMGR